MMSWERTLMFASLPTLNESVAVPNHPILAVEWVNYIDGGHGMPTMSVGMVKDYYGRIIDWYDRYLKATEEEDSET